MVAINSELMEKCRRLEEYAIFIARVRKYMTEDQMPLKQAIILAMEECIEEGVLEDILRKQRDEVLGVLLTTFYPKKACKRKISGTDCR